MLIVHLPSATIVGTSIVSGCSNLGVPGLGLANTLDYQTTKVSPFRWRAGNLTNRAAAGKFIRSQRTPQDKIRPVQVQNSTVIAQDCWDGHQLLPPGFNGIGNLNYVCEAEQFNWGFKPPILKTYQEDAEYQNRPQVISYYFADQDVESDQPSIKSAVVSVVSGFDADELSNQSLLFACLDIEQFNWGFKPPVLATARDEVYYENVPQTQQLSIVPEIETEIDNWGFNPVIVGGGGTQLMGFRGFWSLKAGMGSIEDWSFNQPVVIAISAFDEDQGIPQQWLVRDGTSELEAITEDFVHEMVSFDGQIQFGSFLLPIEQEGFGFNTPVATVVPAFDQDELPVVMPLLFGQEDLDKYNWGFATVVGSSPMMMGFRGYRVYPSSMVDVDQFGFQIAVVTAISAFDQDEGIEFTNSIFQEQDSDQVQSEFFAADRVPEDFDQLVMINQLALYWTDDDATQSTFFAQEQYADQDEQFAVAILRLVQEEVFGQQPLFVQEEPLALETMSIIIQSTDEDVSQSTFFAQEQYADFEEQLIQQRTYWLALNDEQFNWAFQTSQGYAEVQEFGPPPQPYTPIQQVEDEQFGMKPPFITSFPSDDAIDQLPNKSYPIVAEDDLVFPPSTVLANMLYDADFNPTMQASYYFQSEDLEKYNWGFKPPMTKVTEDDSPYDARPQLQSYFIPAIEDEQFSFGFDKFYALGQEDIDQQLAQRSFYFQWQGNDEDSAQSTFFAREQFGDADEQFVITTQLALYWTDQDLAQSAFFSQEQYADIDEQFVVMNQRLFHEEDFGFTVIFAPTEELNIGANSSMAFGTISDSVDQGIITNVLPSQDEQWPIQPYQVEAEDEVFGFSTPVVTVITAFDTPDNLPSLTLVKDDVDMFGFNPSLPIMDYTSSDEIVVQRTNYAEAEVFGFDVAFAQAQDEVCILLVAGQYGYDEAQGITTTISIETDSQQPNSQGVVFQESELNPTNTAFVLEPSSPDENIVTKWQVQFDDPENFGLNVPFILYTGQAWEIDGLPPNPPWPVLDNVDYNDFIKQINYVIPIFYSVSTSPLMVLDLISSQPQILVYSAMTALESIAQNVVTALSVQIYSIASRLKLKFASIFTQRVG